MPLCPRAQRCDRATAAGFEPAELVQSTRDIGLSNPIRVEPGRDGRYELIQGWRRLTANHQLLKDTAMRKAWTAFTRELPRGAMRWNSSIAAWSMKTWPARTSRLQEWRIWPCVFLLDPHTAEHDPDSVMAIPFMFSGYQKRSYIRTSSAWSRSSARH